MHAHPVHVAVPTHDDESGVLQKSYFDPTEFRGLDVRPFGHGLVFEMAIVWV